MYIVTLVKYIGWHHKYCKVIDSCQYIMGLTIVMVFTVVIVLDCDSCTRPALHIWEEVLFTLSTLCSVPIVCCHMIYFVLVKKKNQKNLLFAAPSPHF